MNRRVFVGAFASVALTAQQRRVTVVASFALRDVDQLIETSAKSRIVALELDGAMLPADLSAVRALRDRFAKAGLRVQAVSWKLGAEADLHSKLTAANALDARYVVASIPGALASKLHAESVRAGVPVALRNGPEGLRVPDEIVQTMRVNSHFGMAFDPARMLADGHDPGVFLRRVARRLTTVYFTPGLEEAVRKSMLRTMQSLRPQATATVEAADAAEFTRMIGLLKPPQKPSPPE